MTATLLFKSNQ